MFNSIEKFKEIEKELFNLGYLNNSYQWNTKKTKKKLIDFVSVVDHYGYFRKLNISRAPVKDFHKRQFISERYGFGKTGLSETSKKYKPSLEEALIPFSWIEKFE